MARRRIRPLMAALALAMLPVLLTGGAAVAQQAPAPGNAAPANLPPAVKKKDACFKSDEVTAEAQVRTGIQLREILRRCVEIDPAEGPAALRSEEHTSELQSLMRISYAVFCLNK